MSQIPIETIKQYASKYLNEGNNQAFCERVWSTDGNIYKNRLKALNFIDKENILDAGFGLGQWTFAMTFLNKQVTGIEFDETRYNFTKNVFENCKVTNANLQQGSIEDMPFPENHFDAIFSYSVILCTDYRKALKEFYRVLKPGGMLYFNTNGLGWYLYNLLEEHNNSSNFSSRKMAIDAIESTIYYLSGLPLERGKSLIMPEKTTTRYLEKLGFEILQKGAEGTINILKEKITTTSFFKGEYYEKEGVYEILCRK